MGKFFLFFQNIKFMKVSLQFFSLSHPHVYRHATVLHSLFGFKFQLQTVHHNVNTEAKLEQLPAPSPQNRWNQTSLNGYGAKDTCLSSHHKSACFFPSLLESMAKPLGTKVEDPPKQASTTAMAQCVADKKAKDIAAAD